MSKMNFLRLLVVLSLSGFTANLTAGDVVNPTKTIHLFNGKDLTNFYTWLVDYKYEDPDKVFSVVEHIDGAPAIRISGQHWGSLITKQQYANYRLVVEFRWGVLTWAQRKYGVRDSGILVHAQGRDGNSRPNFNGPWMRSIECQVGEGITGDFIVVRGYDENGRRTVPSLTVRVRKAANGQYYYDPAGQPTVMTRVNWSGQDPEWKDVLGFRGKNDLENPFGEWTRLEVMCEGDSVTNIVNGKIVNMGTGSGVTKGKIMFQSEGAEVYLRRVDLEPLTR
jgi:hypothetical protein